MKIHLNVFNFQMDFLYICTAKFCVLIDINNCMGYNILTGFNSQVMTCVIFQIINNILKEKGDI